VPGPGWHAARPPANTQVDTHAHDHVEFDANARGPWDFKPAVRSMQVHPGELTTVMYEFTQRAEPHHGGPGHPQLRAAPGEFRTSTSWSASASMNTRWPRARKAVAGGVRHRPQAAADVTTITLSYTFFEVAARCRRQGPERGGKAGPASGHE
jgi:cytochrome c oxidase assembly protein subunit 11